MNKLFAFGLFVALPCAAFAQVAFTVEATANGSNLGYIDQQTYTFVFETGSSFENGAGDSFSSSMSQWDQLGNSPTNLWSSVGGTSFLGAYAYPTDGTGENRVVVYQSGAELNLAAGADYGDAVGLTTPDGTPVGFFQGNVNEISLGSFDFTGSESDAVTSLTALEGTDASVTGSFSVFNAGFSEQEDFTVSGLTVSAVPEPATIGRWLAAAALGAVAFVRFRRRAVA